MKKKILGSVLAILIGTIAVFNVDFGFGRQKSLSKLHLANVEVLAQGESGGGEKYDCYSILKGFSGQSVSCSTCQMAIGIPPWYHFGSKCSR